MQTRVERIFKPNPKTRSAQPLFIARVPAGFPSPAADYEENKLDLNQHLIKHPAATYFVRVTGDSMIGAGIHNGDLLVVDRSLEPRSGKVVIASLDGELAVKRIRISKGRIILESENPDYPDRRITNGELEIWGVVTNVIHQL